MVLFRGSAMPGGMMGKIDIKKKLKGWYSPPAIGLPPNREKWL
jgi:hypothetical protein